MLSKLLADLTYIDNRFVSWSTAPRFAVEFTFIAVVLASILTLDRFVPKDGRVQFYAILAYSFFRLVPTFSRLVIARSQVKIHISDFRDFLTLHSKTNQSVGPLIQIRSSLLLMDSDSPFIGFDFKDFQIHIGSWTLLKGPSGIGKTTYLKQLSAFHSKRSEWVVDDDESGYLERLDLKVALVSQQPYLLGKTLAQMCCLRDDEYSSRADYEEALAISELDFMDGKSLDYRFLSGGERKQIALARALISKPTLLILDEFPAGLEYEKAIRILSRLKSSSKLQSVLMTSHEERFDSLFDFIFTTSKI